MSGGGEYAVERRELLRDKTGDIAEVAALDDDHEIVSSAGEIAGDDLVKTRDAHGQSIEATAAFRGDTHFDKG